MNDPRGNATLPPIIVVKRRKPDEHGSHGGVWKIAYADFMTAMMAFFLVMWLVNSADEKTIVQVASYFNPIKLSDKSPSQRGLHDGTLTSRDKPPDTQPASGPASKAPRHSDAPTLSDRRAQVREANLFFDPSTTLDKLDTHPAPQRLIDRDPAIAMSFKTGQPTPDDQVNPAPDRQSPEEPAPILRGPPPDQKSTRQRSQPHELASNSEIDTIRTDVIVAISRLADPKPAVDVQQTREGVLISVVDIEAHEMFARGSAEPRPMLVTLVDRIGMVLSRRNEPIVIRGHTDSVPFRSPVYDNWRLSTARSHMAHYMLLRAGVHASRIERVEGYADRQPRLVGDPSAPQNRRIEFLLRSVGQQ